MVDKIYIYLIIGGILLLVVLGIFLSQKLYIFMSLKRIDEMDGVQFEKYLLYLYSKQGYRGHLTKTSGDFGADLILYDDDEKIAVQAKRYDRPVGVAAVQQALAGQQYYDCDQAMVVTNMTYTRQAKQLAAKSGVVLVDRDDLLEMMKQTRIHLRAVDEQISEDDSLEAFDEENMIDIAFHAKVGHEDAVLLSESVIYTILVETLEDHGYFVDGE